MILIDGNIVPRGLTKDIRAEAIVKGDSKSILIGLASIIAKDYRDDLMERMNEVYPGYGFDGHVGYGTKEHREQIIALGVTPIHRKSFKGVKEYIEDA